MDKHHEPNACERVPYTAYYANGKWSCQFRCATCGEVARHSVIELGLRKLYCNGITWRRKVPRSGRMPAFERPPSSGR